MTLNCTDECGDQDLFRWDNPENCCKLFINATGNVTIFGSSQNNPSYFRFSDIEIYAGGLITLGSLSVLDTTGMGFLNGPGFVDQTVGGCYAAQSGFCDSQKSVRLNATYGTYFQMPN